MHGPAGGRAGAVDQAHVHELLTRHDSRLGTQQSRLPGQEGLAQRPADLQFGGLAEQAVRATGDAGGAGPAAFLAGLHVQGAGEALRGDIPAGFQHRAGVIDLQRALHRAQAGQREVGHAIQFCRAAGLDGAVGGLHAKIREGERLPAERPDGLRALPQRPGQVLQRSSNASRRIHQRDAGHLRPNGGDGTRDGGRVQIPAQRNGDIRLSFRAVDQRQRFQVKVAAQFRNQGIRACQLNVSAAQRPGVHCVPAASIPGEAHGLGQAVHFRLNGAAKVGPHAAQVHVREILAVFDGAVHPGLRSSFLEVEVLRLGVQRASRFAFQGGTGVQARVTRPATHAQAGGEFVGQDVQVAAQEGVTGRPGQGERAVQFARAEGRRLRVTGGDAVHLHVQAGRQLAHGGDQAAAQRAAQVGFQHLAARLVLGRAVQAERPGLLVGASECHILQVHDFRPARRASAHQRGAGEGQVIHAAVFWQESRQVQGVGFQGGVVAPVPQGGGTRDPGALQGGVHVPGGVPGLQLAAEFPGSVRQLARERRLHPVPGASAQGGGAGRLHLPGAAPERPGIQPRDREGSRGFQGQIRGQRGVEPGLLRADAQRSGGGQRAVPGENGVQWPAGNVPGHAQVAQPAEAGVPAQRPAQTHVVAVRRVAGVQVQAGVLQPGDRAAVQLTAHCPVHFAARELGLPRLPEQAGFQGGSGDIQPVDRRAQLALHAHVRPRETARDLRRVLPRQPFLHVGAGVQGEVGEEVARGGHVPLRQTGLGALDAQHAIPEAGRGSEVDACRLTGRQQVQVGQRAAQDGIHVACGVRQRAQVGDVDRAAGLPRL